MRQESPRARLWRRCRFFLLAGCVAILTTEAKLTQYGPDHSPTRHLAKSAKADPNRADKAAAVAILRAPLQKGEAPAPSDEPLSPIPLRRPAAGAASPADSRSPPRPTS